MRKPHALAAFIALALAACGDGATAPTDADLLGTWTITPAPTAVPGVELQRMTVQFGAGGSYRLEASTWTGRSAAPLAFGTQAGSVSASGGQLLFHPSSAFSVGRNAGMRASGAGLDLSAWDPSRGGVAYQVIGDHLVLRLSSPFAGQPLVLTRTGP